MHERRWLVLAAGVAALHLAGCGAGRAATPRGPTPAVGKAGAGVAIGATDEREAAPGATSPVRAAVEQPARRRAGGYSSATTTAMERAAKATAATMSRTR